MTNVKVFSTPSCPYCHKLKDFLKENNIPFTDYDVSRNRDAAMEMIRRSGQRGVPVADIDGNIVVGFNQPLIEQLLKI